MLSVAAYSMGSLQDARSLLIEARADGLSIDQVIAVIDAGMPPVGAVSPARPGEWRCPSCGRFVLVRPRGVSAPVWVCPACRWSVYEGVR